MWAKAVLMNGLNKTRLTLYGDSLLYSTYFDLKVGLNFPQRSDMGHTLPQVYILRTIECEVYTPVYFALLSVIL